MHSPALAVRDRRRTGTGVASLLAIALTTSTLAAQSPAAQSPAPQHADMAMAPSATRATAGTSATYHTAKIEGITVAYREAGDPKNPTLVLLGGFPSSSHMFRDLIPQLAGKFHLIAPDYPGFGNTDLPDPSTFEYSFDHLASITEQLLVQLHVTRFGLYMQDYGGPIGNRIVGRHPDWLQWQVIQNGNAYEEGFTGVWDGLRNALWKNRTPQTEAPLEGFLELAGVKQIYLTGSPDPSKISPDAWNSDLFFLARPGAHRAQLDLLYDYRKNVPLYPTWQKFMRDHQTPTLIVWGKGDVFFTPEGATAYKRDLPKAELHFIDAGHFALEDHAPEIAQFILRFYATSVPK